VPSTNRKGPLRLLIGTTGHRDLRPQDVPALESEVQIFLRELQEKHPHTELLILSALAEGADRLVARVAAALKIPVFVPLPMPAAQYVEDFKTEPSRIEFFSLLSEAAGVIVVDGEAGERDSAYGALAIWIARHSQLLIALWDGNDSGRKGGTSEVVRLKLDGIPDPDSRWSQPLDPEDTGPVHHITTKHAGDSGSDLPSATTVYPRNYGSPEDARDTFEGVCRRMEEFNADAASLGPRLGTQRSVARAHLSAGGAALAPSVDLYTHADALAGYFRDRTLESLTVLFVLVFAAFALFELFAHDVMGHPRTLILYLLLFAVTYGTHLFVKTRRYQDRYLDYRALAEGLRVQYYWQVAGVSDSAADRYMHHQRDELDWIRNALRQCEMTVSSRAAPDSATLNKTLQEWVTGQHEYFKRSIATEERSMQRMERWIRSLIGAGLVAASVLIIVLLVDISAVRRWRSAFEHPGLERGIFLIVMALPAAAAALLHGYAEKRALASHIKRYRRIQVIYANARRRLENHLRNGDLTAAQTVLRELGSEALEENGEWVILHRDRPLEVPHPG
jgi:hypothetical protein